MNLKGVIKLAKSIAETVLRGLKIHRTTLEGMFSPEDENHILEKINDKDAFKQYQQARGDLREGRSEQWKKLELQSVKKSRVFTLRNLGRIAALFIGLAILGGYLYTEIGVTSSSDAIIQDNAITLELEDGTIKIIDPEKKEDLINTKGEVVGVQNKDSITYSAITPTEKLAFNELKVPYGKKFLLSLSDGTQVHLNAGTSLRYPIQFLKGLKREVFLDGEAYFDVVNDKSRPFSVNMGNFNVEVLGTQFNISSYEEDELVNTSVVSGLVQVYDNVSDDNTLVTPGRMVSWSKITGNTLVREVDLDLHVGWIKGKLIFRRTAFSAMIKKLERIYDVDITCNNDDLNSTVFSATFDVDIENIDQVLNYISKNYHFTYARNQNSIIIN